MLGLRRFGAALAAAAAWWSSAGAALAQNAGADKQTPPPAPAALGSDQMQVLQGLGWLLLLLVAAGAALILALQYHTRVLAEKDDKVRERFASLPLGVPEGTVRGMVSMLIVIIGLAVLVVQGPLHIASTEAVAGFISAVIAFYFVTRQQAQTTDALRESARALDDTRLSLQAADFISKPRAAKSMLETLASAAATGAEVSHRAVDTLLYDEVAAALEEDVSKFSPSRPMGKGGDNLVGYNFQAKWLRPIVSDIFASAKGKAPLQPHANLISISNDDAYKMAQDALKGDAGAFIAAIVRKIENLLAAGGVKVVQP